MNQYSNSIWDRREEVGRREGVREVVRAKVLVDDDIV